MDHQRDTGANYSAMPQQTPTREVFRQPSDDHPQTISDRGGFSYSARPTDTEADSPPSRETFAYSGGNGVRTSGSGSGVGLVAAAPVPLARPSMMDRNIEAVSDPTNAGFAAKTQHYNGRYRVRLRSYVIVVGQDAVVPHTSSCCFSFH
jgi:hypothetical protein